MVAEHDDGSSGVNLSGSSRDRCNQLDRTIKLIKVEVRRTNRIKHHRDADVFVRLFLPHHEITTMGRRTPVDAADAVTRSPLSRNLVFDATCDTTPCV